MTFRRLLTCLALLCLAVFPARAEAPELVLQLGHSRPLTTAAFSPDGTSLLTGSNDGSARLWDLASGRSLLAVYPGALEAKQDLTPEEVLGQYSEGVTGVAFRPDGRAFATATRPGQIQVWDAANGRQLASWTSQPNLISLDFSRQGDSLAVANSHGQITVFDAATGKQRFQLSHGKAALRAIYTPDGQLASFGLDREVKLWDPATGAPAETFAAPGLYVTAAAFSKAGRLAVAGPRSLIVYPDKKVLRLSKVEGLAFAPDGKTLLVTSQERLQRVDVATGSVLGQAPSSPVAKGLVVSPDGSRAATSTRTPDVLVWDTRQFGLVGTFQGRESSWPAPLAFSADGRRLAAGSGSVLSVFNLDGGRLELVHDLPGAISAVDLSKNGRWLAAATRQGAVWLWSIEDDKQVAMVAPDASYREKDQALSGLSFSPDDSLLAVHGAHGIRLLEVPTGATRLKFSAHHGLITGLCVTPRGFASCDLEGRVLHWDKTGKILEEFKLDGPALSVAADKDGQLAVAGPDKITFPGSNRSALPGSFPVQLRFSDDGKLGWVEGKTVVHDGQRLEHASPVSGFATQPGGGLLVTHAKDEQFRFWSAGGQLLATLATPSSTEWVAFDPQGRFDGSTAGQQRLEWRIKDRLFALEQFYNQFFTPGLLGQLGAQRPAPERSVEGLAPPPRVRILSPEPGQKIDAPKVTVRVEFTDQGGGIASPSLYLNDSRAPAPYNQGQFEVQLVPGSNVIRVTATNRDGTVESRPDRIRLECTSAAAAPRLHVLAVGIDRYQAGMNLSFARADALAIGSFFKPGLFAAVQADALTDEQATRQAVLSALARLKATAPQDTVLVYLAGHGTTIGDVFYFMPSDARVDTDQSLRQTCLSSTELGQALDDIPATKQILVLDACHSGASNKALSRLVGARDPMTRIRAQQRLARSSGVFLIAASTAEQAAKEYPELGHGVLTYAILRALGEGGRPEALDDEGVVTANSLLTYVAREVPRLTRKFQGSEQIPVQFSTGQDFPLITP
ncbi:MAG: caspase family protein [Vulcanimicrobiota bacterium]